MTSTSVGNQVLSSNTYLPNNGLLSTSTYGNGDSVSYTYDNLYRTTGKSYDGQTAFTYVYDAYGNLARTTDLVNNVTYTYQYDMVGRTIGMDTTQGQTLRVSYDDKNRTDYVVSKVGDTSTKTQYVYGETENGQKTGLIYGIKVDDQDAVSYTYDELARLSSRTLNIGHNNGLTTFYEYLDGNSVGMTTPLVSKISMGMTGWNYTYDSRGNIETIGWGIVISPNPFWHWRYYYDELNQLVREDNEQQNKTITYSYDVGGNITSRTEYPYTTGELGTPTATITYSYDDSNWKDKLTSYNGSLITYDEIGNPLIYHDGKQFTWQHGRQMASLHDEGLSVSYTYDDSGIRTSKTVNGTKTQYYLNGSTILTQITGDDRLDFFYDENGLLIGFSYNGEKYYYFRNLQNDIVSIYDGNGNQVVSYTYDSWGKLLSIEGSAKDTIGVLNPFRYRGYYYDTESGFYYLNSRYYDPVVGRFLNADIITSVGATVIEKNVFAYVANNPVNYSDPSGNWIIKDFIQWYATNCVMPVIRKVKGIFSNISATISGGLSITGSIGAIQIGAQIGGAIDAKGNIALQASVSSGLSSGTPGGSITAFITGTNAPEVNRLTGPAFEIGASMGALVGVVPLAGGIDVSFIPDPQKDTLYYGVTGNIGFGTPGLEMHALYGETYNLLDISANVFTSSEIVYAQLMEW